MRSIAGRGPDDAAPPGEPPFTLPPDLPPDLHAELLGRVRAAYARDAVERAEAQSRRLHPCPRVVLWKTSRYTTIYMRDVQSQSSNAQSPNVLVHIDDGTVSVELPKGGWWLSLDDTRPSPSPIPSPSPSPSPSPIPRVSLTVGHCAGPHAWSRIRFMAGLLRDLAEGRGAWFREYQACVARYMAPLPARLVRHAAAWRAWTTANAPVHFSDPLSLLERTHGTAAIQHAVRMALLPLERQADTYRCPF